FAPLKNLFHTYAALGRKARRSTAPISRQIPESLPGLGDRRNPSQRSRSALQIVCAPRLAPPLSGPRHRARGGIPASAPPSLFHPEPPQGPDVLIHKSEPRVTVDHQCRAYCSPSSCCGTCVK